MRLGCVLAILFVATTGGSPPLAFTSIASVYAQITFVQSQQEKRGRNSGQQVLPPEKRKILSNIGPDELFPGEREAAPANQSRRAVPRLRVAAKSVVTGSPDPTTGASPAAPGTSPYADRLVSKPSPSPAPLMISTQSQTPVQAAPKLQLALLAVVTFVVLVGLIYVLLKLRELLREDNT